MKLKWRIITWALVVVLAFSFVMTVMATKEYWADSSSKDNDLMDWSKWKITWESVKNNYEQIALTPGEKESQLNFGWYSQKDNQAKVRLSVRKDMSHPVVFKGTSSKYKTLLGTTYYSNKVTAKRLKSNKVYYYQYLLNGVWSECYKYETKDPDSFSFLYVGDPQIGASKKKISSETNDAQTAELAARNDAYSWYTTLKTAINENPKLSFIISIGDQINEYVYDGSVEKDLQQEMEYAGFLSPDVIKSLPVATAIGNHDSKTANYQNHFNNPNSFTEEINATKAGYDYYFTYGSVLFIVLDTNNYNCADHEALLKKATEDNPDSSWRVVTFHQDSYGSGNHSDSDSIILRTQLTTLMDSYDIDVVLQGHDHTYSRSYLLTSDGKNHKEYDSSVDLDDETIKEEFLNQNLCYNIVSKTSGAVTNPEGVLYMVANSSTGSKYYDLISTKQDYIAARSQTWTPTYSIITVTNHEFTINTYDVSTGEKIDEAYTIKKTND